MTLDVIGTASAMFAALHLLGVAMYGQLNRQQVIGAATVAVAVTLLVD